MVIKKSKSTLLLLGLFAVTASYSETHTDLDQVEQRGMDDRLQRLEDLVEKQQLLIEQLQADDKGAISDSTDLETSAEGGSESGILSDDGGLDISGFFDVQAFSANQKAQTFELGDLEVDLEYVHDEHYSASSALVWDGDGSAEVAVAVVDYHLFDDNIPPRGRIFSEPGFHLQLGRFDIPFGADYQYFASVDRPNISAPLTTQRIQSGGYNGDGVRSYGSWKGLDGALFWTNSLYGDSGYSVGGRIGLSRVQNVFSFHHREVSRSIEVGLSYLQDREGGGDIRNRVYAVDLTIRLDFMTLVAEYFDRDNGESLSDGLGNLLEERDETAYHLSLFTDLQSLMRWPVSLFGRYERWQPKYDLVLDVDDESIQYAVQPMSRVTLGMNYRFTDYFQFKLEYYDYLGDDSEEPEFEQSLGVMQVVMGF